MTAGQISDYIGAAALHDELPKAQWLLADVATMPTGSGMPWRTRASNPASRAENRATSPSNTTNAATGLQPDRDHVRPSQGQ